MAQPSGGNHIAVSNQKGGVGKTMCAINVAGALNERGHDVLLIDADPQGNATEGLGHEDAYERDAPNLRSVLVDDPSTMDEIVVEHDEMDLVPSNIELISGETELINEMQGRLRLQRAVGEIEDEYDWIVYDCPPSLVVLTDAALISAENVLIPALAESTSQRAMETLFDQIDTLEEQFGTTISERGIVANRVEPDGESKQMMDWFRTTFEPALPVWEIRKRVALKRAWASGSSIFRTDEDCDMADRFTEIAIELEDDD